MKLSRDHQGAIEAHAENIMRCANRWLFAVLAAYGVALAYLCWRLGQ